MALRLPQYTNEQWITIAMIVPTITLLAWFQSDFTGVQRVTSTSFAFLATIVGTLVGFRLFDWPE